MAGIVLVGAQWGDEGKGKITDLLADDMDYVVRFQGGNNAGHTIIHGGRTLKLHLIPSGIMYPHITPVIGNEVTTKHGRFNAFPIVPVARVVNHQQEDWAKLLPEICATPGVKVIMKVVLAPIARVVEPRVPTL